MVYHDKGICTCSVTYRCTLVCTIEINQETRSLLVLLVWLVCNPGSGPARTSSTLYEREVGIYEGP